MASGVFRRSATLHTCEWPPPAAPLLVFAKTGGAADRLAVLAHNVAQLPPPEEAACMVEAHADPDGVNGNRFLRRVLER